jgi:hypothetical protein
MAQQEPEAKRDVRVEVKEGKVQFKNTGGLFTFLKGMSGEYQIINISHRGLKFLSKQRLGQGDKLSFNIGITLLGNDPLKADGKVVWVEKSKRYGGYLVGVRFTSMTRDSVSRLNNLINFLGSRIPIKQRVKVTFDEGQRSQPTLWAIARDFDVTVNIKEGLVTDRAGWLVLEIEGEREEIRRVLEYLKTQGAKLAFPKKVTT